MKRTLFITALVLIAAAYLAGYLPAERRLADAEAGIQQLRGSLDRAEAINRLGEVLGLLLRLSDAVALNNFGEAASLSSGYFDRVRQEALRQPPDGKAALERLLQTRDGITAALARTDASVAATLREHQIELRRALGYPVGEVTIPPPAPGPP
jgi:hypothetical protein